MWREDVDEPPIVQEIKSYTPVDLDELEDGRCKASSWRVAKPARPNYESHFGPGGYNRCVGSDGHVNRLHKDEWGYVFMIQDDGSFKVLRHEESEV